MEYRIGQRWLCHADSSLGLGLVQAVDGRRVTLHFPAVDEDRTYAIANAPLARLKYREGDVVRSHSGVEITVTEVREIDGVLLYDGLDDSATPHTITELILDSRVELRSPLQRLLTAQVDPSTDFDLRHRALAQRHRWQSSDYRGLLGSRTALLPHQLYIAQRAASQASPRVLLADEVGLGKTIEAGLILQRQLLTGRAGRVLILVPEPLMHQWLIEMLRRFSLSFALLNRERLDAEESYERAFAGEQCVITAIDYFDEDSALREAAAQAGWDLLIVDEAHHLSESDPLASARHALVRELSSATPSVLLLTATPEQLGKAGYFAQLQLLDPARYPTLEQFLAEEARYGALADLIDAVERGERPPDLQQHGLDESADNNTLVQQLLDRHGTGRVMFRNTRRAIQGFPERRLHRHPLTPARHAPPTQDLISALYPELDEDDAQWLETDPRVAWLVGHLKAIRPEKALIICAHASTALQLEHYLHLRAGIRSAAFHEGLSIVERDRAAAYFADSVQGAQTLVCSEIGSEGRNFQFARHLILFDLPPHPDLLEQRIGRLDRIGRQDTIEIHVPYLVDSAQHRLLDWYDSGLQQFNRSFSAGNALLHEFRSALFQQLLRPDENWATLLAATRSAAQTAQEQLQVGRDRLLERNSWRRETGEAIVQAIVQEQRSDALAAFLESATEALGVEYEAQSNSSVILRPTDHQKVDQFPQLPDEGVTLCYDRELALQREDWLFMSWDHPMIQETLDLIVGGEIGSAALATLRLRGIAPGTLLLESLFTLECAAPRQLGVERYIAQTPLRLLLDQQGRNLADAISSTQLSSRLESVRRSTAAAILQRARSEVETMAQTAATLAEQRGAQWQATSVASATEELSKELERLRALAAINPAVRPEEITAAEQRLREVPEHIARATMRLQGLRLIIAH